MFKQNFIRLCNERGESPSYVCRQVGITPATYSLWTDESVPRKATLARIAAYFGVSVEFLLSDEPAATGPTASIDPRLLALLDTLDADQLAEVEQFVEFVLSKKGGDK
jgi:transcriptional regulator with XRE-family HTH domain